MTCMKQEFCIHEKYCQRHIGQNFDSCILFSRNSKPMTNEEWFCQLSTEEKAKWLYDHYVNARAEEFYGRDEKTLYDYQKWLVDVHKRIDGTRVG